MAEDQTDQPQRRYDRLRVCVNFRAGDLLPSCGARGSKELAQALREEIERRGDFIKLEKVHCMGRCHIGPTLKLLPGGPFLQQPAPEDAIRIVELLDAEAYEDAKDAFPDPGTVTTE